MSLDVERGALGLPELKVFSPGRGCSARTEAALLESTLVALRRRRRRRRRRQRRLPRRQQRGTTRATRSERTGSGELWDDPGGPERSRCV